MIRVALRKLTIGEHLQEEDIFGVIRGIREGEITDVQIAGFLVALLMKGPTIKEVASIARAMRANCEQITPAVEGDLMDTCGTGGGQTTFNCSTTVALVAAAAGSPWPNMAAARSPPPRGAPTCWSGWAWPSTSRRARPRR